MCGRVRFTAHGLYLHQLNIETAKWVKSSRMHFAKYKHSAGVNLYCNTETIQHNCVCAGARSCHPLCELLWGMNLATTVMVWFIALHPQHNLALRSDGPISRQIAQHPTVTRNARYFPRIINDRHYMWLNALVSVLGNISFQWRYNSICLEKENH